MRYCFALDLINDQAKILEYEQWHQNVWPAILESIRSAGILEMQIYRAFNRLFMIMETTADFSFEKKARIDAGNEAVQQWEELMWQFQLPIPGAEKGEKWVLMKKIFDLKT